VLCFDVPRVAFSQHPDHLTTIVVIPARYESTRFPGKPLVAIAGRPMIEHVYARCSAARGVAEVIVATDDVRIQEAVEAFGGRVRLTRTTHPSGTDRIAEVAADLDCDIVVNVQGDEPLIEADTIERLIEPFGADHNLQMSTLRTPLGADEYRDPNVVKVVVDQNDHALYFSRLPIPFVRSEPQAPPPAAAYKHSGLYAYRRTFLLRLATLEPTPLERLESLEQLRALEHGYRIRTVETRQLLIGVDTPADIVRVEHRLAASTATGRHS
jgi:3-deoxy-manno-octulosonate cytidylyltransferase (CMP-KDO synthetase)